MKNKQELGDLIGETSEDVGAQIKGELLSNSAGAVLKGNLPRECHTTQVMRHIEVGEGGFNNFESANKEDDVGIRKAESGKKEDAGSIFDKPDTLSALGVSSRRTLSNLHEIEIRQAEESEEETYGSQSQKRGHTWTRLQKSRADHTVSLDVVVGQRRSKQAAPSESEIQPKKRIAVRGEKIQSNGVAEAGVQPRQGQ